MPYESTVLPPVTQAKKKRRRKRKKNPSSVVQGNADKTVGCSSHTGCEQYKGAERQVSETHVCQNSEQQPCNVAFPSKVTKSKKTESAKTRKRKTTSKTEKVAEVSKNMSKQSEVQLQPSEIFYSQCSIANKFSDGGLIGALLDDLFLGRCFLSALPPIHVSLLDGKWFTADNRRLWVMKQLEILGRVTHVTVKVKKKIYVGKLTTKNEGNTIQIRGDPGGLVYSTLINVALNQQDENEHQDHSSENDELVCRSGDMECPSEFSSDLEDNGNFSSDEETERGEEIEDEANVEEIEDEANVSYISNDSKNLNERERTFLHGTVLDTYPIHNSYQDFERFSECKKTPGRHVGWNTDPDSNLETQYQNSFRHITREYKPISSATYNFRSDGRAATDGDVDMLNKLINNLMEDTQESKLQKAQPSVGDPVLQKAQSSERDSVLQRAQISKRDPMIQRAQPSAWDPVLQRAQPSVRDPALQRAQPSVRDPVLQRAQSSVWDPALQRAQPSVWDPALQRVQPFVRDPVLQGAQPFVWDPALQRAQPSVRDPALQRAQPSVWDPVLQRAQPSVRDPALQRAQPSVRDPALQRAQPSVRDPVLQRAELSVRPETTVRQDPKPFRHRTDKEWDFKNIFENRNTISAVRHVDVGFEREIATTRIGQEWQARSIKTEHKESSCIIF